VAQNGLCIDVLTLWTATPAGCPADGFAVALMYALPRMGLDADTAETRLHAIRLLDSAHLSADRAIPIL
jgi:hypothetical protein